VGTRVQPPVVGASLRPHEAFARATASHVTAVTAMTAQGGPQPGHPFSVTLYSAGQALPRPGLGSQGVPVLDQKAALDLLRSILVSFTEPEGGEYGVANNGLGYRDRGTVHFQLKGLVGADGKPVGDQQSAYTISTGGPSPTITINGVPSATVSGARVRARLMLGNQWTGYRVAAMTDTTTGYSGFVRLKFQTGSAVEEMAIDVEVLQNPFNPWFLPKIGGDVHLVFPAAGASGPARASARAPARAPALQSKPAGYTLEAEPLSPAIGTARSSVALGGDKDEFGRLRRTLSKTNEISNLAAKPSLIKTAKRKVVDAGGR
jgi:hypothetical protein